MALVAAAEAGCEVAQYTSNEVKQAVVGYGGATKEQVQRMVASVLGLAEPPASARRGRRPGPGRVPSDHGSRCAGPSARPAEQGEAAVIGSLRGQPCRPARPPEGEVIVDVGGVGYRVSVPTVDCWPSLGRDRAPRSSSTCTPTSARTPSSSTASPTPTSGAASRRCSAPTGSGPSLALAILSSLSPAALSTAVLEEDVDTLCTVPGVGRKTAARLLLDLKAGLDLPTLGRPAAAGRRRPAGSRRGPRSGRPWPSSATAPTRSAARSTALDDESAVEEMLRRALRELARR